MEVTSSKPLPDRNMSLPTRCFFGNVCDVINIPLNNFIGASSKWHYNTIICCIHPTTLTPPRNIKQFYESYNKYRKILNISPGLVDIFTHIFWGYYSGGLYSVPYGITSRLGLGSWVWSYRYTNRVMVFTTKICWHAFEMFHTKHSSQ